MGYFDNKGHKRATCNQCGKSFKSIYLHWSKSQTCDNPNSIPYHRFALFSGGHDSLVSTHYSMQNGLAECVVHLDTNTGIDENQEYVESVCEEYGWPLKIYTARMTLKEFALEFGFPKAPAHSWAYRYFKERSLFHVARDSHKNHQHMYTGVRRDESARRMKNVDDTKEEHTWTWHAPIADWTKKDCNDYIEAHDLPRNDVVKNIHRSGECYCGAFAHRDEELIDLAANYPDHAEWLLGVEKSVQEVRGTDDDTCWWGSQNVEEQRLDELKKDEDSRIPMLCQQCGITFDDV